MFLMLIFVLIIALIIVKFAQLQITMAAFYAMMDMKNTINNVF